MVQFLDNTGKSVDSINRQAKKINLFQQALQLENSHFEKLDFFIREFQMIEKTWRGRKEWQLKQEEWRSKQFLDIDVENVQATVERLNKSANLCSKELPTNPVARLFKEEVDGFKDVVACLMCLRDPAIQERNWDEIRDLLRDAWVRKFGGMRDFFNRKLVC